MALPMTPIFTQTVGSGGSGTITFNNIPQHFTDLKLVCSVRTSGSAVNFNDGAILFNNDGGSNYSVTYLIGDGSASSSSRGSSMTYLAAGTNQGTLTTSNTFTSWELYLPSYTSSTYKSCTLESVAENNATATKMNMVAGLWRSTSAVNRLDVYPGGGYTFLQYSTFSLYGILRPGA